jgi:hypothetical protein
LDQIIAAPREVAAVLHFKDASWSEATVAARARRHKNATKVLADELQTLMLVDQWLRNVFRSCGQACVDDEGSDVLDRQILFATGRQLAAGKMLVSQRILMGATSSRALLTGSRLLRSCAISWERRNQVSISGTNSLLRWLRLQRRQNCVN